MTGLNGAGDPAGMAGSGEQGDRSWLDEPIKQIGQYFDGRRQWFDLALDWRLSHGVYRRVLDALMDVEYGTTVVPTGSWPACRVRRERLGPWVLPGPPSPIPLLIPCHRVVRSDGSVGEYGGSPEVKGVVVGARALPPALMARLSKLDRSVAGQVAVVTGAASGRGRATAWLLADEGAKVAALDVNRAGVEETGCRHRR